MSLSAEADAEAAERLRSVRERLEATGSGLGELEYLRQRQEELVRTALDLQQEEQQKESHLSSEEKLLEDNILLLRKQLNCLRRRDGGLITQLQELDRQISDLRLDTETPHGQVETDSRPSSGFYEQSDGASGSLSNSSNSVFSDAEARFPSADELPGCSDCDGLVGGLFEDPSSSGAVRRSLSGPHPPALDAVSFVGTCDHQSRYHYDLVARNGSDVFRYPSPLHAVAVQSPAFLQMLGHGGHKREDGLEGLKPESSSLTDCISAPHVPQSCSWPIPSSSTEIPPHKRLESYIYGLVQRRALSVRASRPRTSITTDPSKSILRQASLCLRQASGPGLGTQRGSEINPCQPVGGAAESATTPSPQKQWSMARKCEEQESLKVFPDSSIDMVQHGFKVNINDLAQIQSSPALTNGFQDLITKDINTGTNSLKKKKSKKPLLPSGVSPTTLHKETRDLDSPISNSSPKASKQPCSAPDQDQLYKSPAAAKTQAATLKNNPEPFQTSQTAKVESSLQEMSSLGSSSQSQEETRGRGGGSHMANAEYVSDRYPGGKLRKGGSKKAKVKTTMTPKCSRTSENKEPRSERKVDQSQHRPSSKKSHRLEDGSSVHGKSSKRSAAGSHSHGVSSGRVKRLHGSIPQGGVLDKHTASTFGSVRSGSRKLHHHGKHRHACSTHHHQGQQHQGRDQLPVVAKPKHKRSNYRRLRAIMEVPCDEALKRAQHRQKKETVSHPADDVYRPSDGQSGSPYPHVAGSDSEYSAECASLFHSTIVDTSEDERSDYTTNCFGDSESSEEDDVEESTATSDTEESGGGGAGGGTAGMCKGWRQIGVAESGAAGQEMTPAQAKAFIKIKASHNLKRKILRFRSGSLKLMTTV
ncbi:dapper homolog 1 [Brachionichthys hirsutus]|uniref:dapper homolog 1 n=1 Tax=Brachionichthys hirsutus TaxID=412623 RepID=UPI003604FBCF